MHYSLAGANDLSDLSSVDLKIEKQVEKEAAFAPWLNTAWVGGAMDIPMGEKEVKHSYTGDPRGFFKLFSGDMDLKGGFVVHAVTLHMHKLGTSALVRLEREDGTQETLLQISHWDFNWQRLYNFEEPVTVQPGDQLTVECHWDNSQENQPIVGGVKQTPKDVNWGEGTVDEMCVNKNYIVEL